MFDSVAAYGKKLAVRAEAARAEATSSDNPRLAKLTIVNLDEVVSRDMPSFGLVAQYNPKEIQIDHQVKWTPSSTNKGDHPEMTFGGGNARSLQIELFFDTYDTPDPTEPHPAVPFDVHKKYVSKLQELMLVMSESRGEEMQRPPRVQLVWGDDLPRFIGVIESVSTKYTMFLPGGRPVRATCSVKMLEADRGSFERKPSR